MVPYHIIGNPKRDPNLENYPDRLFEAFQGSDQTLNQEPYAAPGLSRLLV